jgi:signal peptidase II
MKTLTILFLALDQITKRLTEHYKPHGSFLFFITNNGIIGSIQGGLFLKFIIPILLFPILLFLSKLIKENLRPYYLSLLIAGAASNYLDRFRTDGVVDFIKFGMIFNFADVYLNLSLIILTFGVFKNNQIEDQINAYLLSINEKC